ncbi:MAG TPA: GerMN domain-containing protein, partial [Candidatus Paceibacterota bacterium]|nr:GerMN domain-containing protein [Candidatus Paceibacterota bacterium]
RIPIPAGTATDNMTVEALSYSPKGDNSYEGYAFAPVKLKQTDTMNVYAAFLTDSNDCTKTTLFPRSITKTSQSPLMSLMELLKGPNDAEKSNGHAVSEIPDGVEINSLRQSGSTIYVDFNQALQQGVAGSCRVQSIRAEITDTLKQFLGVTNVVISINGKTTGILQP